MVISVNDYKQIRQRYLNGESQRSIAKSMGISRNTVKKYCKGENVPWERKTPEREASVLTEDVLAFITSCLEEDEAEGLKKQRHTARRIFDRLVEEKGFEGGESTIRRAVHEIRGKKATVGEMFREERCLLRRLPLYVFETAKCMNVRVNAFSTVRFKTNTYSVPVKYVGYEVSVKGYPETVEIYYKGERISTHIRLIGKNLFSYQLDHYMPLLRQRPRAIFDAAPVKQNIPPEVLEELKSQKKHDNVISLLERFASETEAQPVITDPVIVRPVDLHQYDALSIGKEVN